MVVKRATPRSSKIWTLTPKDTESMEPNTAMPRIIYGHSRAYQFIVLKRSHKMHHRVPRVTKIREI
jgi:hypothetical protein